MAGRRHSRLAPTRWPEDQLDADRLRAIAVFREERLLEPAELYRALGDRARGMFEALFDRTNDLTEIEQHALTILTDDELQVGFRYLAGPPISEDDLKTLVDTNTLSAARLRGDPALVDRVVETVLQALDHRRFPWIAEGRGAQPAERDAAIQSSSAMLAMRQLETKRRNEGKASQEALVHNELLRIGLQEVPTRNASTLALAPGPGEFCTESYLAGRKADFIVGLWDHRTMPVECKVSNSSVNSVKRLNNDAAAKAEGWINDLGAVQVIPVAVLSGIYKLENLKTAQQRGLTLYWAHRLPDLGNWILKTKP